VVVRVYCSDTKYKMEEDDYLLAFLIQQMDLVLGMALEAVSGFVLFLYLQYIHTN